MTVKHLTIVFITGLAAKQIFGAGMTDIQVGQQLTPLLVRNGEKTSRLDLLAQDRSAAILLRAASLTKEECGMLAKATERLASERIKLLAVVSDLSQCGPARSVFAPVTLSDLEKLTSRKSWRLMTIDPAGTVRLIKEFSSEEDGVAWSVTEVSQWEGGRQVFISACGHCHGEDGADTSYAGVKSLAQITRRLTDGRILEGGQQFGAVDMSAWPQSSKDALLLYIRGL